MSGIFIILIFENVIFTLDLVKPDQCSCRLCKCGCICRTIYPPGFPASSKLRRHFLSHQSDDLESSRVPPPSSCGGAPGRQRPLACPPTHLPSFEYCAGSLVGSAVRLDLFGGSAAERRYGNSGGGLDGREKVSGHGGILSDSVGTCLADVPTKAWDGTEPKPDLNSPSTDSYLGF